MVSAVPSGISAADWAFPRGPLVVLGVPLTVLRVAMWPLPLCWVGAFVTLRNLWLLPISGSSPD
eukprot:12412906-Karenia_brevis.AAC.1